MTIDWLYFTPWRALLGGAMIGLAAALLILFNGRIAGISGILGGLLRPARGDLGWRLAFLAALMGAPLVYALFAHLPTVTVAADTPLLIAAGLLVGLGTR
ncbi:putative membrane protein YedE/YeeE [Oxalobacteraceae bacterium GrIS 1.11]